jgi:hypothetical protein
MRYFRLTNSSGESTADAYYRYDVYMDVPQYTIYNAQWRNCNKDVTIGMIMNHSSTVEITQEEFFLECI